MSWNEKMMALADTISTWSKMPTTKVGAVTASEDHIVLATGYNGFPRGIEDTEERMADVETRRMLTVHAEMNAIINAAREGVCVQGGILYCAGLPPCLECAKAIVNAGIQCVVTRDIEIPERWGRSCAEGHGVLMEADVDFDLMESPVEEKPKDSCRADYFCPACGTQFWAEYVEPRMSRAGAVVLSRKFDSTFEVTPILGSPCPRCGYLITIAHVMKTLQG